MRLTKLLPDSVVFYEKASSGRFESVSACGFAGYQCYYSTQIFDSGPRYFSHTKFVWAESAFSAGVLPKDSIRFSNSRQKEFLDRGTASLCVQSHIETSSRNEVKLLNAISSSGQGIAAEKRQAARDGCLRGTGKSFMEMVPANQSVAAAHTPQQSSYENTPIVDSSSSSDANMAGSSTAIHLSQFNQLNQQVRVEKAQILQQQQNVVNLTADEMILAEAQRVVA